MDDLVLIFGGTSTIGALGVPFILSFILMLLAVISGAVLMTGAMGTEKKVILFPNSPAPSACAFFRSVVRSFHLA